jgi:hypothetical protein
MNLEPVDLGHELQQLAAESSTYGRRRLTGAKENRSNLLDSRGLGGEVR